jgi:hypothetical protein
MVLGFVVFGAVAFLFVFKCFERPVALTNAIFLFALELAGAVAFGTLTCTCLGFTVFHEVTRDGYTLPGLALGRRDGCTCYSGIVPLLKHGVDTA